MNDIFVFTLSFMLGWILVSILKGRNKDDDDGSSGGLMSPVFEGV